MSNLRNGNNGTSQACAACKYQRRKCAPDCILAPFFPHHRQRQFLNAHKLFGVSNITKILKNLDAFEKEEAMRTIIIQSDVRASDPVGGCYRIIRDLQRQIEYTKAELDIVLHQLAICKAQSATSTTTTAHDHHQPNPDDHDQHHVQISHADHDHDQHHHGMVNSSCHDNSEVVVGNNSSINGGNADPLMHYQPYYLQMPYQEPYVAAVQDNNNNNNGQDLQDDVSSLWGGMQDSLSSSSSLQQVKQQRAVNSVDHFDDIKHFDGQAAIQVPYERSNEIYFEPDHIVHRSEEAMLRVENGILGEDAESIQHAQDHDLKGAATLFTLTNCNSLS